MKPPARPGPASLSRRDLLIGSAALAGAACLGGCRPGRRPIETFLAALLDTVPVTDPVAVGDAFLRANPFAADPPRLLDAVIGTLPLGESLERCVDAFSLRLRDEFARGDMIRVDGWMVAPSEACLCALVAIDRVP